MKTGFLKCMNKVLVSYVIIAAIAAFSFHIGQAEAANGKEAKVTSPGGYTYLQSQSQDKGFVKIIVRVSASFTPESRMQESDRHAQRSATLRIQDQVIADLENKGHKPGRFHKYKYTPFIAMTVDSDTLEALLSSPDVISVEEDIPAPPALDLSVPRIGVTQLHAGSIKGAGIAVAILDTGVDKNHPFLQGSAVSEACYSTKDKTDGSSSLCPGGVEDSEAAGSAMPYGGKCPLGMCDHGTHVAGIVAGRSSIGGSPGPGVAPEANIIAIQVFSRFDSDDDCGAGYAPCVMSWSSDQMLGLERVYELRNTYTIAAVNMSLGGGQYYSYCDSNSLKPIIDTLRAAGIATIISSGNNYWCGSMGAPACISSAISVGATDDSDTVANYSNSATFLSLLAPGSSINSSIPGGSYISWGGTSMATPHVAGAWALMKQAYPAATVDDILSSFTSTGKSITDAKCTSVTKRRINVYESYNSLSSYASLTVVKTGVGTGTVASSPSGINCGEYCDKLFLKNISVTLNSAAYPGSAFGGWSGGGCSGTGPCIITLSTTSSVTASFLKEVTIGTEITITGSDFGIKKGKVLIGDVAAKVANNGWTHDTITITVAKIPPGSLGILPLTIVPKGKGVASIHMDEACTVKAPLIDSLSDNHGPVNAIITINGKFFSTGKPKVYIEYNDKNGQPKKKTCKVSSSWPMDKTTGESKLEFVVPKGLDPETYSLKVSNKVGDSEPILFTIN